MAPPSPKPSSTHRPESTNSAGPSRKRRRERRAANRLSSGDGTPLASGSSTPHRKLLETEGDDGEKGNTRSTENDITQTTFEEGEDFIPFTFSGPEDDELDTNPSKDWKGKGKQPAKKDDEGMDDVNEEREGKPERAREKHKDQGHERDWDRGKNKVDDDDREKNGGRNGRHKRKHDAYDRDDGYTNKKQRTDAASRKCPWIGGLDLERCQNVAEMLHLEVEAFIDWISPTAVEDEVRGLIVTQISSVVTSAFPDAVVHPFGSYQTKLYLPLGDIDLVVLSDSMAYSDKSTVLHRLANTLKRAGITSHVTIIAKAKVPIVKFVTTHGRFKVDISINQGNGLVSGQIISGFLKDMIPSTTGKESKALRALVMITKAFLTQRSMNEVYTGGLGSYSIVCLAVSFLQMHPKIRRAEIDPEQNLGVLAMEFFELYGHHFNYDEVGISLRDGGMYFSKRQRGWHAEYKRNMLSIEDPADPSNDISSGSYNFHKVRTAFAGCHGILTSTAYMRAGILSSRHQGRSVRLRSHYEPEDLSILATVMGITQETINHRRLVQELYDRQVLHNIVGVKPLQAPIYISSGDEEVDKRKDTERRRPSSSSKSKASRGTVESTRDKDRDRHHDRYRDRDRDFDDDHHYEHSSRHRRRHRDSGAGDDDRERSRYDIGRQPPKKRRRTGRLEDAHTVYLVEDDDDGIEERKLGPKEDGEYISDDSVEELRDGAGPGSRNGDRNRSYWLSKAKGIGGGGDEDSH